MEKVKKLNFQIEARLVRILFVFFIIILCTFSFLCQINIVDIDPGAGGVGKEIGYKKLINNNWEICLNNLSGTKITNVSNNPFEDGDPAWSPDGKYIAFTHFDEFTHGDIYLFNVEDNSLKNISSNFVDEVMPKWSPNGSKIIYDYHKIGEPHRTYMMNPDGSGKEKILDCSAKIFFLNDNFRFVYQSSISYEEDNHVFLSDIKGTFKEKLFDITEIGKNYTTVEDFNPLKNEILLRIANKPQIPNTLATFNIYTKKIDTISIVDSGWVYFRPIYSRDYSKIAVITINYDEYTYKIILLDDFGKRELFEMKTENQFLDFNPMTFSPHDKYLAYAINIQQSGYWVSWKSYLYILHINSKVNFYIDEGKYPIWNPIYKE